MPTSRTFARRALGLAAVPALLLGFAACGDDDDDTAGGDSGADFCDQARDMESSLEGAEFTNPDDVSAVTDVMNTMDPPDAIADDWNTMLDALNAISDVDVSDPEAVAEIQNDPQFQGVDEAADNIDEYMTEECDI